MAGDIFPTLSIVWVHWGMNKERSILALRSIRSLVDSTRHLPVEIIVVDNSGMAGLAGMSEISCYIRNAENRHFGYARNQGLREASGGYLAVSDNDIIFKPGVFEACMQALLNFPDEKIIASPLDYPMANPKYRLPPLGTYRRNLRAGSNFWIMRRKTWEECGPFLHHRIAGSKFSDKLVRAGYSTVIAGEGLAEDAGLRNGYNFSQEIRVVKRLANGSEISL